MPHVNVVNVLRQWVPIITPLNLSYAVGENIRAIIPKKIILPPQASTFTAYFDNGYAKIQANSNIMRPITAPCATCDERIIRVDRPAIPKCTMYKDGIPAAILYRDRKCPHPNIQTSLDGSVKTRSERNTGRASLIATFIALEVGDLAE